MDNNLNILGTLAKAGIAGICIALVSYIAYDRHMDYQLYQDHLKNNTEVSVEVRSAITANTAAMEKHTEVLRGLEKLLLQLNGK